MRLLRRRLPVLRWLPEYSADLAVADLVAGLTLGLTMLPQSIAYAQLAGVAPQVSTGEHQLPTGASPITRVEGSPTRTIT